MFSCYCLLLRLLKVHPYVSTVISGCRWSSSSSLFTRSSKSMSSVSVPSSSSCLLCLTCQLRGGRRGKMGLPDQTGSNEEIIHCGPCFHRNQVYWWNGAQRRSRRTRVITATDKERSSCRWWSGKRVRMTPHSVCQTKKRINRLAGSKPAETASVIWRLKINEL